MASTTYRLLIVVLLLAIGGCSPPEAMVAKVEFSGVAYDTFKDPNTAGVYRVRCAFDEKHEAGVEQLKPQALLNGVQAAQNDGYEFVTWSGPYEATLNRTVRYGHFTGGEVYRAFEFVIRGYKDGAAAGSRPISIALLELANGRSEQSSSPVAPASSVAAQSARFAWPLKGNVMASYGSEVGGKKNEGIDIAAAKGATVTAADSGFVIFAGNLREGQVLLIQHSGDYISAYGYNDALLVKQGDIVTRGQAIALVGMSSKTSDSRLYFEVRHAKKTIDPLTVLPPQ